MKRNNVLYNAVVFLVCFFLMVSAVVLVYLGFDFLRFPEKYSTTMKYQLQCDILSGDEVAIEYYNSNYVEKGIILFD